MQPPQSSSATEFAIKLGFQVETLDDLHWLQKIDLHARFRIFRVVSLSRLPLSNLSSIPESPVSERLEDLFDDRSLDFIWLSGRDRSTIVADQVLRALNSGKHVVIGRPVEFTPDEWKRVEQAAKDRKRSVILNFPSIYDSDFQAAGVSKELLGQLTKIRFLDYSLAGEVTIQSDSPLRAIVDPLVDPGLFRCRGLGGLYQLLHLHPYPVERIYARRENEANLSFHIEFSDGLSAFWESALDHSAPFHSGWYLQGTFGGYAGQCTYRIEPDGELVKTSSGSPQLAADLFPERLILGAKNAYEPHQLEKYRQLFTLAAAARRSLESQSWEYPGA